MTKSAKSIAKTIDAAFEEKTTLDTVYLIDGSSRDVTLEIIVGAPEQTAVTDIILGDNTIVKGKKGSVDEFPLGANKNLNGKKVLITTVMVDTSKDTNNVESIIRLRGGFKFIEYPLFKVVKNEGDSAIFSSSIEFFKL
ncbi:MAG: hypothetical protein DI535_08325 [Citrobacter freundii]|nr:MAG: hypothetical protein DI535_08325 [Citrobacter freundii]